MTQINMEHVSPEIKAILCAMQQQIDDLNKRVIAAETRADRAEARVLVLEKQIQAKDAEIAHLKETVPNTSICFSGRTARRRSI